MIPDDFDPEKVDWKNICFDPDTDEGDCASENSIKWGKEALAILLCNGYMGEHGDRSESYCYVRAITDEFQIAEVQTGPSDGCIALADASAVMKILATTGDKPWQRWLKKLHF